MQGLSGVFRAWASGTTKPYRESPEKDNPLSPIFTRNFHSLAASAKRDALDTYIKVWYKKVWPMWVFVAFTRAYFRFIML